MVVKTGSGRMWFSKRFWKKDRKDILLRKCKPNFILINASLLLTPYVVKRRLLENRLNKKFLIVDTIFTCSVSKRSSKTRSEKKKQLFRFNSSTWKALLEFYWSLMLAWMYSRTTPTLLENPHTLYASFESFEHFSSNIIWQEGASTYVWFSHFQQHSSTSKDEDGKRELMAMPWYISPKCSGTFI